MKRSEYESLYGTSPSRIDLLNKSARGFFVLPSLWEDVLLHLCRLTDDPEVGRRQMLTVRRLPTLVDPAIRDKVRGLVSAAVKKTKFARVLRNRHIAHRDLRLALNQASMHREDLRWAAVEREFGNHGDLDDERDGHQEPKARQEFHASS